MLIDIPEYQCQALCLPPRRSFIPPEFDEEAASAVYAFHEQLPDYTTTPLVTLERLAKAWGVGDIFIKDESTRFHLKAFKVLGGSYAIARLICQKLSLNLTETDYTYLVSDQARQRLGSLTFTTATDGNHGRGVAWAAQQLGQKAVIFVPRNTAPSRIANIQAHGATVEVTDLNYDDAVRLAARMAEEKGWHMIQDTAWPGYEDIPLWIMQGYMTMAREAAAQMLPAKPSHVFIQAGVGALAGAVVGYFANRFRDQPPHFIIIEPNNAACLFASAKAGDGQAHRVTGNLATIMAGLACGEPNLVSWKILRENVGCFVRCDDYVAANGIRILATPIAGDHPIEAGESGSVGIGLLDLICNHKAFRQVKASLAIEPHSNILFFNTEGATDPVNYREILWYGRYPSPNQEKLPI